MTPDTQEEEDEVDPVEAVERAVRTVDRAEYDGHGLKQLIKNANDVSLPDAGRFLLKALRSDDAPIRREGDVFVRTDAAGSGAEEADDAAGADTEPGTNGDGDGGAPEGLRDRPVWAVRDDEGEVTATMTYEEAVGSADDDDEVGYAGVSDGGVATLDVVGCVGDDGFGDSLPEPPFDGAYTETLPDRDGWRIPVVGCEVPDWWSDVHNKEGVTVELSTDGFRVSGEAARRDLDEKTPAVATGGRALEEWLADVARAAGDTPFGGPAEDTPEIDGATLSDEHVKEALGHVDPDAPYHEWRRIGAALADNYDDKRKAQRVFEAWSRQGSVYDECEADHLRGVDDTLFDEAGVGYLVHKACLNGWVWEADDEEDGTNASAETTDDGRKTGEDAENRPSSGATAPGGAEARSREDFVERNGYGYATDDGFDRVTNFELETRRCLVTDGGDRLLRLTVRPGDEEPYDVTVEPTVFNSPDRFEDEVVTGFGVWFDGGPRELDRIREKVAGGGETVRATTAVGLHGDEFVTPAGTLEDDGLASEPRTVYAESLAGGSMAARWATEATTNPDDEDVSRVLKHLPGVHPSGEFLTMLGWFYAAPLKPFVVECSDYFPTLWLTGDVEAAKPKLRVLNRAFGTDGEPFAVGSDDVGRKDVVSESRSVPVWYDGHSGGGAATHCSFDPVCARSSRCAETADGGEVRRLTAPVLVAGDEPCSASVERLSVQVRFGEDDTADSRRSLAKLTGRSYYAENGSLRHPDGADLAAHAMAYFSWIAGRDDESLGRVWEDCRRSAGEVLRSRGDAPETAELHDVRVTLFGLRMYQSFAEENGVEPAITSRRRREEVVSSSGG